MAAGLQLGVVGVDEQADADPGPHQAAHHGSEALHLSGHVQAPLGRHLFAAFRHQGHHVGADPQGDRLHFRGGGHLQVETGAHGGPQQLHVPVLDVAAVLPQVHGDAVGAAQLGEKGAAHRIGFHGAASLPHVGDVIDVDPEAGHGRQVAEAMLTEPYPSP